MPATVNTNHPKPPKPTSHPHLLSHHRWWQDTERRRDRFLEVEDELEERKLNQELSALGAAAEAGRLLDVCFMQVWPPVLRPCTAPMHHMYCLHRSHLRPFFAACTLNVPT